MTSLESRVQEALKQAGILEHSQRFIKAETIVNRMKLTDEERIKAQEIAKEWCK